MFGNIPKIKPVSEIRPSDETIAYLEREVYPHIQNLTPTESFHFSPKGEIAKELHKFYAQFMETMRSKGYDVTFTGDQRDGNFWTISRYIYRDTSYVGARGWDR